MSLRKIIGIHSCKEALKVRSIKELQKIYFKPDWQKNSALFELAKLAEIKKLKPETLSLKKLNQIGESHQGVCVFATGDIDFDINLLKKNSVVLILDQIQDPKNLGSIIRTSWLMGVDGIFITSRRSALLSPYVMKAASGGVEYVPIEVKDNLHQCLNELKKNQFWIYGLDANAETSLWTENFEGRVAFLLGGEQSGIRKGLKKTCDKMLSIPQKNQEASFNVSVTVAMVLGECFKQQRLVNV